MKAPDKIYIQTNAGEAISSKWTTIPFRDFENTEYTRSDSLQQEMWKPNEEQMKALNEIINTLAVSKHPHESDYLFNVLNGLRKDLKKLWP